MKPFRERRRQLDESLDYSSSSLAPSRDPVNRSGSVERFGIPRRRNKENDAWSKLISVAEDLQLNDYVPNFSRDARLKKKHACELRREEGHVSFAGKRSSSLMKQGKPRRPTAQAPWRQS